MCLYVYIYIYIMQDLFYILCFRIYQIYVALLQNVSAISALISGCRLYSYRFVIQYFTLLTQDPRHPKPRQGSCIGQLFRHSAVGP